MIFSNGAEFTASPFKVKSTSRIFILRGDVITIDVHSIRTSLCTPFFLRN